MIAQVVYFLQRHCTHVVLFFFMLVLFLPLTPSTWALRSSNNWNSPSLCGESRHLHLFFGVEPFLFRTFCVIVQADLKISRYASKNRRQRNQSQSMNLAGRNSSKYECDAAALSADLRDNSSKMLQVADVLSYHIINFLGFQEC